MPTESSSSYTGGQFLLEETSPATIFTPEDFTDEQRAIAATVRAFIDRSVLPHYEEFEHGAQTHLGRRMMQEAAAAGILLIDIPEEYGGMGADKATVMLVSEVLAWSGSFTVTHGAHSGIGTLPIVHFGTAAQRAQYLPRLGNAELIGAYALTEPGSGSDALAARTTATPTADGAGYLLNGTKQYISNAGFADLFIVFAKVNGDKFTAFIVERDTPGLSIGPEERKMGIKGSSTCQVILEDARVPAANVLGEIGRGHVIAFEILNVGRFKLGAGTVGGCKVVLEHVVPYVRERRQFGRALAEFPLIRRKLADVAARTFAAESMVYRTAGLMDAAVAVLDRAAPDFHRRAIAAIGELSVECSLIKVFATESTALAAEEGVQMLGGYGFSADYPLERIYRDERVNRIFEGTNEINRLLVTGMILRKALKGELPLFAAAKRVGDELMSLPSFAEPAPPQFLDAEAALVTAMKKTILAALGLAAQKHGDTLKDHQEILSDTADMIMEAYACESALLRVRKRAARDGEPAAAGMADLLTLYAHDAIDRVEIWGRQVLAMTSEGDELRTALAGLRRLTKHDPVDRAKLHDAIAARLIEAGGYVV